MPKPIEISVDEFLDRRSLTVRDGVVYKAARMPKTFDGKTRSAVFVMTDETTDSYGDTVRAKGADLTRFEANPICLLNHRSDLILGTWDGVEKKPRKIEGRAVLAAEGTAPHIDMAYSLMEQGILRAASIGFMPKKLERKLDDKGEPTWAYDILEWEMYECSVVSVPANPAALAKSIKDGNMLARDFLEEVLDTYTKTAAGLIVPRSELEDAHKEATGGKLSVQVKNPQIEFNQELLDRLDAIVERMENATSKWTQQEIGSDEPEDGTCLNMVIDGFAKDLEEAVEGELVKYETDLNTLDLKPERKSTMEKLIDGIRSVFKTAPEPAPEPVKADPAVQEALRKQVEDIASRHALGA